MSIKSSGLIELTCSKCDKEHILNSSDLDWNCEEKSTERKGIEICCKSSLVISCDCGNEINIKFKANEYPQSEFDSFDFSYTINGGRIVFKEFKLYNL